MSIDNRKRKYHTILLSHKTTLKTLQNDSEEFIYFFYYTNIYSGLLTHKFNSY